MGRGRLVPTSSPGGYDEAKCSPTIISRGGIREENATDTHRAGAARAFADHDQGRDDQALEGNWRTDASGCQRDAGGGLQLQAESRRDELRAVDGAHRGG